MRMEKIITMKGTRLYVTKVKYFIDPTKSASWFCFFNFALPGQIGGASNWVWGGQSSLGWKLTEFRTWNWGHPPGSWNPSHRLFIASRLAENKLTYAYSKHTQTQTQTHMHCSAALHKGDISHVEYSEQCPQYGPKFGSVVLKRRSPVYFYLVT